MSDSPRRKPLVRFSIAALLFLMLCLGGYLTGYRAGYERGNRHAADPQLIVVSYPVGDLLTARTIFRNVDYSSLVELIVTTVGPDTWMANGTGDGEIQPFPDNLSLVISQTRPNHQRIATLLQQLRNAQARVAASTPKQTP